MQYVSLIVTLALLEYIIFIACTGKARVNAGLQAPAVTGDEAFERCFRVQQNTLEQLIIFIPAIYIFAAYINPLVAVGIGLVFIVGRVLYFKAYISAPAKRGVGFMMSIFPNLVLVLGGLIGVGLKLV